MIDQIKELDWRPKGENPLSDLHTFAESLSHEYVILDDENSKYKVRKTRFKDNHTDYCTGFKNIEDAKDFSEKDHVKKMNEWLKPEPLTQTLNWFKTAKPEPNSKDIVTQIGCHFEEVAEMIDSLNIDAGFSSQALDLLADKFKTANHTQSVIWGVEIERLELLDSLADQIVTAVGVAHMMGFDIIGALTEVNKSNYSKFVDGKAVTDKNGKIIKGENYFKPDLEPFVGEQDD